MIEDLFGSEPYHVLLAAIGLALLLAYALPGLASPRATSSSWLLMVFGLFAFTYVPGMPQALDPVSAPRLWELVSELVVIVVLFSTGLRIDEIRGLRVAYDPPPRDHDALDDRRGGFPRLVAGGDDGGGRGAPWRRSGADRSCPRRRRPDRATARRRRASGPLCADDGGRTERWPRLSVRASRAADRHAGARSDPLVARVASVGCRLSACDRSSRRRGHGMGTGTAPLQPPRRSCGPRSGNPGPRERPSDLRRRGADRGIRVHRGFRRGDRLRRAERNHAFHRRLHTSPRLWRRL